MRSAISSTWVDPWIRASTVPVSTKVPSRTSGSSRGTGAPSRRATSASTTGTTGMPASTPRARATTSALRFESPGIVDWVVTSRPGLPPRSSETT